jgi:hypothetical protein
MGILSVLSTSFETRRLETASGGAQSIMHANARPIHVVAGTYQVNGKLLTRQGQISLLHSNRLVSENHEQVKQGHEHRAGSVTLTRVHDNRTEAQTDDCKPDSLQEWRCPNKAEDPSGTTNSPTSISKAIGNQNIASHQQTATESHNHHGITHIAQRNRILRQIRLLQPNGLGASSSANPHRRV